VVQHKAAVGAGTTSCSTQMTLMTKMTMARSKVTPVSFTDKKIISLQLCRLVACLCSILL
jgi:hypothetical protein